MLPREMRVGYGDAHREEVEGDLPSRIVHHLLPATLVAVGMVDNEVVSVNGV